MGANIFRQSVLILLILAFVGIAGVSAATVNYYTLNEPVTTPQGLTLESFRVSGENPEVSVGDTVNVMQMMSYLSGPYYQLIIDQPGGLTFDIVNPEGRAYRLGSNYVGKTISQGDYVSVKDSFVPDIAGVWKIKPSFTVTSGTARGKFFPPETWPVAEITVAAVEDPKPDLVIEGVTADFDYKDGMITKITYVVKNVGDVDAGESVSKIMIDGAEVAESSVGFLPAGKSLTVFVPVNVKYNGPSSLIEVTPNANKAVDEANHENNYFDAIIDNPADSSVTTITAGPTSESLSQSATTGTGSARTDVVSADTCLAYTQNCNSIFTCSVIGLLAILLSAVTFALGYFYGVSKNCTKEMAWMRSKISYLRSTDPNAAEKGESDSGSSSGPSSAAEKFIEKYYGESASDKKDDGKDGEKDGAKEDDKKSDGKKADTDKSDDADAKKSESKDKKDKDSKDRKDADKDKSRNKDNSADIEFEYAEESDESESAKK
ncbi:MAG: hypothetical protein J6104_00330 [Methanomicrobium sp.]|nr:hypothetical protein [Methanomicrobium sp.]